MTRQTGRQQVKSTCKDAEHDNGRSEFFVINFQRKCTTLTVISLAILIITMLKEKMMYDAFGLLELIFSIDL